MENEQKILEVDYLDVLFKDRNKAYGAYILRKKYSKRMFFCLSITILVVLFISILLFPKKKPNKKNVFNSKEIILNDIQLEEPKPIIVPPSPSKKMEVPKPAVKKFTPPKVVPDKGVKKKEIPPKQEELKNAAIGNKDKEGDKSKKSVDSDSTDKEVDGQGEGASLAIGAVFKTAKDKDFYGYFQTKLQELIENFEVEIVAKLEFTITSSGDSINPKITILNNEYISNEEKKLIEEKCEKVIKGCKWDPAINNNGEKISTKMELSIRFALSEFD